MAEHFAITEATRATITPEQEREARIAERKQEETNKANDIRTTSELGRLNKNT